MVVVLCNKVVSCVAVSLCKQHITAVWLEHLLWGGAGAARGASLVRGLRGLSAGEGDGGSQLLVDLAELVAVRRLLRDAGHGGGREHHLAVRHEVQTLGRRHNHHGRLGLSFRRTRVVVVDDIVVETVNIQQELIRWPPVPPLLIRRWLEDRMTVLDIIHNEACPQSLNVPPTTNITPGVEVGGFLDFTEPGVR